jgi:hypothetical protein
MPHAANFACAIDPRAFQGINRLRSRGDGIRRRPHDRVGRKFVPRQRWL